MDNSIKFIHTADIHLGKKLSYSGNPEQELLSLFDTAGQKSLKRLVELGINKEVDFIIIAGDLYDREARSVKSSRFFLEQCQQLKKKGIKVYIISGNHDPAGRKKEPFELPDNIFFFSSEEVEIKDFYKDGRLAARILGQSYRQKFESRSMYNFYTPEDDAVFNLGILHTSLDADNRRYVPVNKSELLSKEDIHYWALGHIHQFEKINEEPAAYYPGTIQGRDINETGEKGALLVEVDQNHKVETEFYSLASVIFKNIIVDLENYQNINNLSALERILFEKIEENIKEIESLNSEIEYQIESYIIRFLVKGRSKIHNYIDDKLEVEESLLAELRNHFSGEKPYIWPHSLVLRTAAPLPDLDEIKNNNSLYKELDQILKELMAAEELERELKDEWGKIWQGDSDPEDRENTRFFADQELKAEILEEAEKIIITELLEDGD